ncbi:MerR family transcriptional regulator [Flavihumibacter stibioxidans]|uniref:MerR family transcriptional regulator n=1 Tax=Flavihumibacter stibioxidans TaxID=1834163 RepID=A0ABR7M7M2_9BACT|nr:MerR family transcriptional regulator [Flavihumibacter stibioxidans]MBC6491008.1 MerR family transcriptional regulator [Flavihumibacter stibioxidans]
MNAFTIRDLENLSGIKAHTIRIWEQRYNFLKPRRTDTNIRYYTSEELKAVLNIALLNKYGYKISHIDKMQPEEIRERIVALGNAQAQQERLINELIQFMVDMDMERFELLLDQHISSRGIDKTITQLLFPFLEKIGILWMTNHINPAQEHLVTNIIRQKLIVGIEGAFSHVKMQQTVLLFLPEGEHHELGLLYAYYLLKSRGVHVIYLGANLPLKDVEFVANLKKPDFLYSHLTSVANNFSFDKFLHAYSLRCPSHRLVISGQVAQQYRKEVPEMVSFKKSLAEVLEFVAGLH